MGKLKINAHLLPIKAHYFCFMAAMGPILPQLSVYGKELGISSVVMGSVTAVLPVAFLLAKPLFGLLVDIYRDYRKAIFVSLIMTMSLSYAVLYVIPDRKLETFRFNATCDQLDTCNVTDIDSFECNSFTKMVCTSNASSGIFEISVVFLNGQNENSSQRTMCVQGNVSSFCSKTGDLDFSCKEEIEMSVSCMYSSWKFWFFIIFMAVGTICFNVANSISDAVCFDLIGDEYDYGKQRLWGTIGFGITALISGYVVNWVSDGTTTYAPAFLIMLIFTGFDLFSCSKLRLPIMETPENIFKDLRKLLNNRHTIVFIIYAIFAGIVDSFMVYFLFWYLEDMALETNTTNIKLIEGMIVAAETLFGEVIFFSISGKILERFGYAHTFSMCFINYALRLGLISVVPSPWWVIPIEFLLQGPTYALTYTTVVAYANAIAPPGMSATMQGIAAGMDDGFGYAIGSLIGGLLYKAIGGRGAIQVFSAFALICSVSHLTIYKLFLQSREMPNQKVNEYKTPAEAALAVYDTSTVSDIHCI